ncbi:glycosyltransferase family 39 protein [Streptomyces sp. ODS28]|uniref:glycosyltransferase family 39 protein n=1 Tax=Streptomyces sp. ODS28 TaxID=3136688 RepID=UPI0031F0EFC3
MAHPSPTSAPARLLTGPPHAPRWARPALWAVLALAAVLYLWNLPAIGQANSFYTAAVYSGTHSWKAFFYGALDAGSFITVDKPPFALWVMGLSCRILGFGTWQMMLPMAAAGVGSVALLYRMVRRAFGYPAATLAALVLALTPMTVAITRDNNPDPVLVLLLLLGAAGTLRAIRTGALLPLVGAAVAVGFGFHTKMLQAYVVLPAFFLAYVVAARTTTGRRLRDLAVAAVALLVSSGWWMAVVDSVPAKSRPYIGGSTDNTVWDLVVGYNGFGRIFGASGGGGGGGTAQGGGFGGEAGIGRMFNEIVGGQISWLIPFAAVALVAGLVLRGRRPRTDPQRAQLLLWGGWFVLHHLVFSLSEGTFHPYYVTAMAPGVAALCGAGGVALFRAFRQRGGVWTWLLPVSVAGTAAWAIALLARTDGWNAWLMPVIGVLAAASVAGLLAARSGVRGGARHPLRTRRLMTVAALASVVAMLAGPSAYAVSAATASGQGGGMNGTNPTAGPTTGGGLGAGMGGPPGGGGPGHKGGPGGKSSPGGSESPGKGGPGGGMGGVDSAMLAYLKKHRDGATWLLAVSTDQAASSAILAGGEPVISMGGWTGSDDAMTLAKLKRLVREGKLHYVQLSSGGGPGGNSKADLTSWVRQHGTEVDADTYGSSSSTSGNGGSRLYRLDPTDVS